MKITERHLTLISFFLLAFFYTWDIHNPDILRQGTEGFYLNISKQMWEKKSFLTPYYGDLPHFSKPPLHFWASHLLFFLTGGISLAMARASSVLVAILGLWGISQWTRRHFQIPPCLSAIYLGSSLGFLKYARIYMLEIPLMILTTLSVLKFYDYLKDAKKSSLGWASLFLAMSCLVKGPVSLIMASGGVILFKWATRYKIPSFWKRFYYWILLGTIGGSLWFVCSFIVHGSSFIDSFFLRENLGKFISQSYPVSHLFQGLFLYGLPWTVFIPALLYFLIKNKRSLLNSSRFSPVLYLLANFLVSFGIWFIPAQKSHHYAIPSLCYFLILILVGCFAHKWPSTHRIYKLKRVGEGLSSLLMFGLIILVVGLLFFEEIYTTPVNLVRINLTLFSLSYACFVFAFNGSSYLKAVSSLLAFGHLWVILMPVFILPQIPPELSSLIGQSPVSVAVHRPYFVEEALSRKVEVLDSSVIKKHLIINRKNYYIIHHTLFKREKLEKYARIVHRWPVWLKRRRVSHILAAIRKRDFSSLKEEMVLIRPL